MRICPGCRRENPHDVSRCFCGYSFSFEHEHSWRGTLFRLLKPLMWIGLVVAGFVAYGFIKHSFSVAVQDSATRQLLTPGSSWTTQEFSGILVDVPVRLRPNPEFDQLHTALASLYSEVTNAHGSVGDTVIKIASMVEARSDLAGVAETAEFTAKSFGTQPFVVSETHSVEDWKRGALSGKLLRLQARLQTQDLSMQVLFIKHGSRRWTVHTSYEPSSDGAALADRIIASVRPTNEA